MPWRRAAPPGWRGRSWGCRRGRWSTPTASRTGTASTRRTSTPTRRSSTRGSSTRSTPCSSPTSRKRRCWGPRPRARSRTTRPSSPRTCPGAAWPTTTSWPPLAARGHWPSSQCGSTRRARTTPSPRRCWTSAWRWPPSASPTPRAGPPRCGTSCPPRCGIGPSGTAAPTRPTGRPPAPPCAGRPRPCTTAVRRPFGSSRRATARSRSSSMPTRACGPRCLPPARPRATGPRCASWARARARAFGAPGSSSWSRSTPTRPESWCRPGCGGARRTGARDSVRGVPGRPQRALTGRTPPIGSPRCGRRLCTCPLLRQP
mmetsp:Transcript_14795/g.43152  ORF Transcript_14795/g.43152 Transcript_14795/m.43152 type:complete len:316 (-) Transcript_14795:1239-2186(-)